MENWNIKKTLYSVSDFLSWQKSKSLELSPSFQRRSVWKKDAKSFLIDTVVRGLPMPLIFLREQRSDITTLEPKREVVDGQQRIRTLISFINKDLLEDFDSNFDDFVVENTHNKNISGQKFKEMKDKIRQKILDYEFSVHILPASVSDRDVLQIFARMNATGVKLNAQEIRNATYYGDFKTSTYNLASIQLERWRSWEIFTEYNIARMEEVEMTSDLINMIISKGIKGRSKTIIDNLYSKYDDKYTNRLNIEKRFENIMDLIDLEIDEEIKNTVFSKKTLFYSLFSVLYAKKYGLDSSLEEKKSNSLSKSFINNILEKGQKILKGKVPQNVLDASKRQTTNEKNRKIIFDYLSK